MAKKLTKDERDEVRDLLSMGVPKPEIAERLEISARQVAAVAAHVTMGTYERYDDRIPPRSVEMEDAAPSRSQDEMELVELAALLGTVAHTSPLGTPVQGFEILLGHDLTTHAEVTWAPDPASGTANPHMLVAGGSGYGKTYLLSSLLAELSLRSVPSIIIDFGQGFARAAAPAEFITATEPIQLQASRDGIAINPLEILPTDVLGPVNVAQRLADTFRNVYPRLGVQQHAAIRQAGLAAFNNAGITRDQRESWRLPAPPFAAVNEELRRAANDRSNPFRQHSAHAASHISTLFVFNVFRDDGLQIDWENLIMRSSGRPLVLHLHGVETSAAVAATEILLWNLSSYVEAQGPGPLRCFVVLDEAHRLSLAPPSPIEKLLREGRKFGLGVILASQQPADFPATAYTNTATKLFFNLPDQRASIARRLARFAKNTNPDLIAHILAQLPRGHALAVRKHNAHVLAVPALTSRRITQD